MQANAVKKLLNLNADTTAGSGGWGEQWKLLIYDRFCRDVISPLINVAELRKQGITLHMLLDSEREEIPDVPCVYFVTPTAANVARIAKDCAARLYTSVHLNFASPLPRPLLEELAKTSVAADAVSAITKVWDQALDYVCLEPRLFTLNQPDSYVAFNDPAASEAALAAWTSRIVQGLFSALATLGVLPIIRAPKGGAAEHIATRLHEMLRAHTQGRSSLFASGTASSSSSASASSHDSFARPVLVLLQRDHDLVTAVHHTATYQALVDDLLSLKMNRVTFEAEEGGRSVRKSYDLDPANDAFYAAYGGREFPAAIEANAEQLAGVAQREAAIRAGGAQGAAGLGGAAAAGGGGGGGAGGGGGQGDIMAAVTSLPALLEKKKMLEQHTAILQGTMDLVMAREVPTLHEVCESMVRTSYADKAKLLEVLAGPGTLRDKVRVLVVAYVATEGLAAADMEELEAAVGAALTASQPAPAPGPDGAPAAARAPIDLASVPEMKVLSYIKKYKQDAARMRLVKGEWRSGGDGRRRRRRRRRQHQQCAAATGALLAATTHAPPALRC